jgi:hypothetical protein
VCVCVCLCVCDARVETRTPIGLICNHARARTHTHKQTYMRLSSSSSSSGGGGTHAMQVGDTSPVFKKVITRKHLTRCESFKFVSPKTVRLRGPQFRTLPGASTHQSAFQ